jgi:hypothetical protein
VAGPKFAKAGGGKGEGVAGPFRANTAEPERISDAETTILGKNPDILDLLGLSQGRFGAVET